MDETITFHINTNDKQVLIAEAEKQRLPLSSFCRNVIINSLFEKFSNGKGRLEDFEELELKQSEDVK